MKIIKVGQLLEVTVFSNTDEDIWDLDHMKFENKDNPKKKFLIQRVL